MFRKGFWELMVVAVFSVFLELRITERLLLGEWGGWISGETIGLLCVAAVGSLAIAIPFICLRFWGVTRRNTTVFAFVAGATLEFLGLIHGEIEMGHFALIPGWVAGSVFAAWIVTVGSAVAIADHGVRRSDLELKHAKGQSNPRTRLADWTLGFAMQSAE